MRHVLAVAKELGIPDAHYANERESDGHLPQDVGALRAIKRDPSDQPDIPHRKQADDDSREQRPHHQRCAQAVVRHVDVRRVTGQVDPRHDRRDERRRERGEHNGQHETPVENLRGKECATQGHVVDRGQSRTPAAGHEQSLLGTRQTEPARDE